MTSNIDNVFQYTHLDLGSFEYVYGRATDKIQKVCKNKSLLTGKKSVSIVTISTYENYTYGNHGKIIIKVQSEDNIITEIAVKIDGVWKTWN
jgi:NifU-like protein involved in Fe-S cluster formation